MTPMRPARAEAGPAHAPGGSGLLRAVPWAVALLLALAPVLLVRGAVTVDGPSHLYNAWVAAELARDPASPVGDAFAVRPAMGQMLVTAAALRALGPVLGWDRAERVWLALLLAALLAALGWYVRGSIPVATPWAPLFLAWVPLGWVTAWGFYDFLAGMVLFTLILDGLGDGGRARILALLALLYFAHLFAFAVAVGVLVLRSLDRADLRVTAAAVVLACAGLVVAAPGLGGGINWDFSIRSRLIHLAFSSTLASVSRIALVAGAVWTALLVTGALRSRWDWRCLAGFLLLVGGLFVPRSVGSGTFLFERVHVLGLIILAPLLVQTVTRLPRLATGMLGLVMAGALVGVFVAWTQAGWRLDEDRRRITALLEAVGVESGAAVTSVFPHRELSLHRAPVYFHLLDRSALDLGAIVADNYQANESVFPVSWTAGRTGVMPAQRGREWDVAGRTGAALYVVHLADASPRAGGPLPLLGDGRLAVTRLDPVEPDPPVTGGHPPDA
jgi:hypothetical protein